MGCCRGCANVFYKRAQLLGMPLCLHPCLRFFCILNTILLSAYAQFNVKMKYVSWDVCRHLHIGTTSLISMTVKVLFLPEESGGADVRSIIEDSNLWERCRALPQKALS